MRFPGFIGPSYTLQSVNVDCQRCVNLFPEINALGTGKEREVAALVPTPGLRRLLTLPTGPTRALWYASNSQLFAVGGNKFYRISSSWVATEIGTLNSSTGPVSIADNGLHVVMVDGTDGYTWTIASNTFAQITSTNFFPADTVTFQDGYFLFNKKGTGQFFITDIRAVTFSALDTATAEGSPDNTVAVFSSNQNVYVFGEKSIEVFYNSGAADFPFNRIQGAVVDTGCAAAFSVAKIGGMLFFIGGDATGSGIVYRMQGYQPQRISTPAIEKVIRSLDSTQIAAARAYTYQQGGHLFYCLNLPGTNSTWVYDLSTEFWHERMYLNLWSLERHRAECHTSAYGLNVVGDYVNGKLYELDTDTYNDDGTSIKRIRTAPHVTSGLKLVRHNAFTLDIEAGVGDGTTGQGADPQASLRFSDDGGHTWSNERYASIGKIGEYKKRLVFRRLGISRDRVYEISITDPVKPVLIGADLDLEEGGA